MNQTQQPNKPGCTLRSTFTGHAAEVLEPVEVPIDFDVTPFQNYSLSIPLKVKENAPAHAQGGEAHHVASFQFHGPRGWPFGEEFKVKFKVEKAFDEVEFYNLAMQLYAELGQPDNGEEISFERVVEVLKKSGNNASLAKAVLSHMTKSKNEKEDENMYD